MKGKYASQLENWRFQVIMQCSGDMWSLHGNVYGHHRFPEGMEISLSGIKEFDEACMTVNTMSGSVYQLGVCGGRLEEQIAWIREQVDKVQRQEAERQEKACQEE